MDKKKPRKRGRPPSDMQGAAEAFDVISAFLNSNNLSHHSFSRQYGMTATTVMRALESRETAAWTPGFRKIYNIAINAATPFSPADLERLYAYTGPGSAAVKRILSDVAELVRALATDKAT